jgi:tetratricopeptide (TPR) repeat protein
MKTCFVITGYGIKKDYINNRDIDLDKTFKHIVKPVFEELGYECKRSCDYPPGIIDTIMYKGIYDADFVIADISTLNPNALYELGVRHALKPYTTLVICEDGIFVNSKLPFDLSHLTALAYHHDGKSLDIDEVDRFKKILKEAVTGMVKANKVDSPVFTHILGLEITVTESGSGPAQKKIPQKNALVKPADKVTASANSKSSTAGPSLSDMIDSAVAAMKNKKFEEAIDAFKKLLKLKPDDAFFIQQLCLATYKLEKPNAEDANKNAYKILGQLNPMSSTDTETLGMAGAIHKNLYKITGDKICLEKSLRFYERGYYIANDYYNGINTAFLYWKLASLAGSKEETQFYKMQAKQIAKHVAEICINLMALEDYTKRNDKEWVKNTLAEAYYGLDDKNNFEKIISSRKKEQNDFSDASFMQQFEELKGIKEKVEALLH